MQELIAEHPWIFAIMCGLPFCLFSLLIIVVIVLRKSPMNESNVLPKGARVAYWSCLPIFQAVVGFVVAFFVTLAVESSTGNAFGVFVRKFAPYFVAAWVCLFSWLSLVSFAMGDDAYYVKRSGPQGIRENLKEIAREFPAVLGWSLLQSLVVGGGVFITVQLIKFCIGAIFNVR